MLIKDKETWTQIVKESIGFIYNDFGTQFPGNSPVWKTKENNKLHKASCRHLKNMTHLSEKGLNKYFFASKKEAIEWLEANRKSEEYTFCKTCKP